MRSCSPVRCKILLKAREVLLPRRAARRSQKLLAVPRPQLAKCGAFCESSRGLAFRFKHLRPNSWRLHCRITPHGLPCCAEHRAVPDGQQSIRSTSRIHMSTRRCAHSEKSRLPSWHIVPLTDAEILLPQCPPQVSRILGYACALQ